MNKRTALFFICLMLFLNNNCTTTYYNNNSGVIKFENHFHDFGEVAYKENCEYSFKYSNHGSVPIVIQDVETSCGCTVPDWPKNPLKPGKSEELKITYDTSQPGVFRKTITVHYNGKDSPVKLSISGNVSYPENYQTNTILNTTLGDCYSNLGEYKKAEAAYTKAYYMAPNRFYPKYLLAKMYQKSGQLEKAKNIAKELLSKEVKV